MNWTPWNGGACPVDPDCQVKYRMRNQRELGDDEYDIAAAGDLDWGHKDNGGSQLFTRGAEIVAYKIHEPAPKVPPEAWVTEMRVSGGKIEYWVNIGYRDGKWLSNRFHYIKGRAEYEAAEWNHVFGRCDEPDMDDFDLDELK